MAAPVDEEEPHHQQHSLSRLSRCSTKRGIAIDNNECSDQEEDDDDGDSNNIGIYASRPTTVEGSDRDADGELSDKGLISGGGWWDSDKEGADCVSLPATPARQRRRRRRRRRSRVGELETGTKEYASENEGEEGVGRISRNWRRRSVREKYWTEKKNRRYDEDKHSGESECLVMTRPKGGRRSLCMDLEEVKACRDLGFELGQISMSCSTVDTSSCGNSPVANWRISSPGDDPRDVKARLKVWAQAVALSTTTR